MASFVPPVPAAHTSPAAMGGSQLGGSIGNSIFVAIADGLIAGDNTDAVKTICLKTLLVFVRNVLKDPSNAKFRRIRATNAKIVERVLSPSGGREFLDALGFVEDGEFLVLPATVDLEKVRAGQTVLVARVPATPAKAKQATPAKTARSAAAQSPADAEDAARRKAYEERMSAVKAKRAREQAERAALKKEIKRDQQGIKDKRAVRVTQASVATNKAFGANKSGWEEIGVKLSDGGGGG